MTKDEFKAYMLADADDFFSESADIILADITEPGVYGVQTEYGLYEVSLSEEFDSIEEAKAYHDAYQTEETWINERWHDVNGNDLPEDEAAALDLKLRTEAQADIAANPYPDSSDDHAAYYWGDFNEVVDGKLVYPDVLHGEGWFLVKID